MFSFIPRKTVGDSLELARRISVTSEDPSSHRRFQRVTELLVLFEDSIASCSRFLPLMLVSIVKMTVGAIYINSCPGNKYISLYLIIAGVFGCVFSLTYLIHNVIAATVNTMLGIFLFVWVIPGSLWIFSMYVPTNEVCDKTLYFFAFWITILDMIHFTITIIYNIVCCVMVLLTRMSASND